MDEDPALYLTKSSNMLWQDTKEKKNFQAI